MNRPVSNAVDRRDSRPVSRHWLAACCGVLACLSSAQAAGIDYTLTSLGGDLWRYDYTLASTAGSPVFDEFTLYFDLPQSVAITAVSAPGDWDAFVAQVDLGLPDGGYVDLLRSAGPVAAGSTTAGFSVVFQAAAGLTPGAQRFDLIQSAPFTVVASGITTAVPEPGSYALMLSGLALLGWAARRQARAPGAAA